MGTMIDNMIAGMTPQTYNAPQAQWHWGARPEQDYAGVGNSGYTHAMENNYSAGQLGSQQQDFINALRAQSMGQGGPSLAQLQLQQGLEAGQKAASSFAGSQVGANPALAMRMAADSQANQAAQAAGQSAQLRQQEMMDAQRMLGGAMGQAREQTLGQMGQNLGLYNTAGQLETAQNRQLADLDQMNINAQLGTMGVNSGNLNSARQGITDAAGKMFGGFTSGAGGAAAKFAGFSTGGYVPGQASFGGDDPDNDTVDAVLSPGEIVIPRSVAQDEDAPEKAAEFVKAVKKKPDADAGYARVLMSHKAMDDRLKKLEMLCYGGMAR